jgi:hypothetical protein
MVATRASNNNQYPCLWFTTKVKSKREKIDNKISARIQV